MPLKSISFLSKRYDISSYIHNIGLSNKLMQIVSYFINKIALENAISSHNKSSKSFINKIPFKVFFFASKKYNIKCYIHNINLSNKLMFIQGIGMHTNNTISWLHQSLHHIRYRQIQRNHKRQSKTDKGKSATRDGKL